MTSDWKIRESLTTCVRTEKQTSETETPREWNLWAYCLLDLRELLVTKISFFPLNNVIMLKHNKKQKNKRNIRQMKWRSLRNLGSKHVYCLSDSVNEFIALPDHTWSHNEIHPLHNIKIKRNNNNNEVNKRKAYIIDHHNRREKRQPNRREL